MKKSRKKKQNSFEFSKLIYLINLGFVAIVTGLSFLCVVKSGEWGIVDFSPITAIVSASFLELATHSVVYANKAKAENRKKGHNIYYESHHILPKSLFPLWKTKKSTLVLLTAREHFFFISF